MGEIKLFDSNEIKEPLNQAHLYDITARLTELRKTKDITLGDIVSEFGIIAAIPEDFVVYQKIKLTGTYERLMNLIDQFYDYERCNYGNYIFSVDTASRKIPDRDEDGYDWNGERRYAREIQEAVCEFIEEYNLAGKKREFLLDCMRNVFERTNHTEDSSGTEASRFGKLILALNNFVRAIGSVKSTR